MTEAPRRPENALDYPHLADELWIIWYGNVHKWPDARRETHYLRTTSRRPYALFTIFAEDAKTFTDAETARLWLAEQEKARGFPYGTLEITTVAEMKRARGYANG